MDKIAYNLLSNAFKNTPVGGKIVMKLDFSVVNDTFTMSVSDNGPGVSVDKQKMLFVRFEQIHYASEGTGVGLHLTAELAKVQKGQVTYVDSLLGGACFSLTIPMHNESVKTYEQHFLLINRHSRTIIRKTHRKGVIYH